MRVIISSFKGSLSLMVVIVFAILITVSTLIFSPRVPIILSSSLYTLYATKQRQTWASMRFSVKWKTGRVSSVPFDILKAFSTTQSPLYWATTSDGGNEVLVTYPFRPSHTSSSLIFSSQMHTLTSLSIFRNLL